MTRQLNNVAALLAAEITAMRKLKGEADTEFVKRIVNAYLDSVEAADTVNEVIAKYMEK